MSLPPLADSERLAVVLGGEYGDGADGQLSRWAVGIVSAAVRSYTRLSISPVADATLILTGTTARRLVVGERPLTAVSSVTLDGTLLPTTDYRWTRGGALYRGAGWGGEDRQVVVVCSYGFATIPPDLWAVVQTAATRLVANPAQWKQQRDEQSSGGEGPSGGSTLRVSEAPTGFTVGELAVLNRYRRRTA